MTRRMLIIAAVPVLALAVASAISLPIMIAYNASASAPIGFYWLDHRPVKRGDYVLVGVPERVRKLVEERRYLPRNVPFIKHVAGVAGDEICRHGETVSINGIAAAIAQKADGLGRSLPDWQGCRVLTENQIFLLQGHPRSFDGRYFGPVDRRLVIGRATRLQFPWRKRRES